VTGYGDPSSPGTTLLGTVDLLNNDLVEWPVTQQGQYTLQLEYAASAVPGGTDPCPGVSSPITTQFTVGPPAAATKQSATRPMSAAVAAGPSGSLDSSIPSWLQVPEASVQTGAQACFSSIGFIADDSHVLDELANLTSAAHNYGGQFGPGYTITLVAFGGSLDPATVDALAVTYANPGAARIAWRPDPADSAYNFLQSPGASANNCAALYHELAHVRDILQYTLNQAALGNVITPRDASLDLVTKQQVFFGVQMGPVNGRCQINGDDPSTATTITVGEARAIQAENAYRQWDPALGFVTFHDYNEITETGSEVLPLEGYVIFPQVCDDPAPLLHKKPYIFP
jgi:hypothetical protein